MNFKSWPAQMQSHDAILILGADTTFGLAAVELAHACGYKVIAAADNERRKVVEEYGADKVFDVSPRHFSSLLAALDTSADLSIPLNALLLRFQRNTTDLAKHIREATQNSLRITLVTTLMVRSPSLSPTLRLHRADFHLFSHSLQDNALEIASQCMPNGGEISVNPLFMAQFGKHTREQMMEAMGMNKGLKREGVTIVERSAVTLFGLESKMDGKTFKDSPTLPCLHQSDLR